MNLFGEGEKKGQHSAWSWVIGSHNSSRTIIAVSLAAIDTRSSGVENLDLTTYEKAIIVDPRRRLQLE